MEELKKENELLKSVLNYINLLALHKDMHLGHPRLSDVKCIFCMSYFALHNGDYGYKVSKEYYDTLTEKLKIEEPLWELF